jgi:hypothetical protein
LTEIKFSLQEKQFDSGVKNVAGKFAGGRKTHANNGIKIFKKINAPVPN